MRRPVLFLALAAVLAMSAAVFPLTAQVDPDLLAGVSARSIGPAAMSGRVADVAVVESNPDILYAGAGEGNPRNSVIAPVLSRTPTT